MTMQFEANCVEAPGDRLVVDNREDGTLFVGVVEDAVCSDEAGMVLSRSDAQRLYDFLGEWLGHAEKAGNGQPTGKMMLVGGAECARVINLIGHDGKGLGSVELPIKMKLWAEIAEVGG